MLASQCDLTALLEYVDAMSRRVQALERPKSTDSDAGISLKSDGATAAETSPKFIPGLGTAAAPRPEDNLLLSLQTEKLQVWRDAASQTEEVLMRDGGCQTTAAKPANRGCQAVTAQLVNRGCQASPGRTKSHSCQTVPTAVLDGSCQTLAASKSDRGCQTILMGSTIGSLLDNQSRPEDVPGLHNEGPIEVRVSLPPSKTVTPNSKSKAASVPGASRVQGRETRAQLLPSEHASHARHSNLQADKTIQGEVKQGVQRPPQTFSRWYATVTASVKRQRSPEPFVVTKKQCPPSQAVEYVACLTCHNRSDTPGIFTRRSLDRFLDLWDSFRRNGAPSWSLEGRAYRSAWVDIPPVFAEPFGQLGILRSIQKSDFSLVQIFLERMQLMTIYECISRAEATIGSSTEAYLALKRFAPKAVKESRSYFDIICKVLLFAEPTASNDVKTGAKWRDSPESFMAMMRVAKRDSHFVQEFGQGILPLIPGWTEARFTDKLMCRAATRAVSQFCPATRELCSLINGYIQWLQAPGARTSVDLRNDQGLQLIMETVLSQVSHPPFLATIRDETWRRYDILRTEAWETGARKRAKKSGNEG